MRFQYKVFDTQITLSACVKWKIGLWAACIPSDYLFWCCCNQLIPQGAQTKQSSTKSDFSSLFIFIPFCKCSCGNRVNEKLFSKYQRKSERVKVFFFFWCGSVFFLSTFVKLTSACNVFCAIHSEWNINRTNRLYQRAESRISLTDEFDAEKEQHISLSKTAHTATQPKY